MKLLGLITEYNPFHNGHLYHLNASKKLTNSSHTVAIMSGHFLQRGEPALFDKWTRAKMAVESGIDLVIELPLLYSSQSAELFASGAIKILNSLNCIDSICFGSEYEDIETLKEIATILNKEPLEFKISLKNNLDKGMLFAKARMKSLYEYMALNSNLYLNEDLLNSPNNILGIEYIKSIISLKSNIKPYSIKRITSDYNSLDIKKDICSASAIREYFKKHHDLDFLSNVIPKSTYDILKNTIDNNFNPVFDEYFFDYIKFIVLRENNNIKNYFDIEEGIENKIIKEIFSCSNLNECLIKIKSKRYTLTKIKRMLNNILLNIKKEDVYLSKSKSPSYIRILAFNDNGREILKKIKKNSSINIITKLSNFHSDDEFSSKLLEYDIKATNIYNLMYYKNNNSLKGMIDYYTSPIYVKKSSY